MAKVPCWTEASSCLTVKRNQQASSAGTTFLTSRLDGFQFSRITEKKNIHILNIWRDIREVVVLPLSTGIGHLPITYAAFKVSKQDLEWSILILIGTMAIFVDALDTYRDRRRSRFVNTVVWKTWMGLLALSAAYGMISSGWWITILVQRFLIVGLLWATPCIPMSDKDKRRRLVKPKVVLCEYKSLFVGIVMTMVCITPVMGPMNHAKTATQFCKSLLLSVSYEWIRETVYDARDIVEDRREGMRTLPICIGENNIFIGFGVFGLIMDVLLTNAVIWRTGWLSLDMILLSASVIRIGITLCLHSIILRYPKGSIAWAPFSIVSLLPAMWAIQSV